MTEEQHEALTKLRDGWTLEACGRDKLGGFLFGGSPREGYAIPNADMKFFKDQNFIRFDHKCDSYVLTGPLPNG